MDDMAVNYYSGKFDYVCFDDLVPKSDFSRFVVSQVKMTFKSFNIENERFTSAIDNKKSYSVVKMLSLIYYAYARGYTKASTIADLAKNHTYFKFVANGIESDEDTINNFINKWGSFFDYFMAYTLQFAKMMGFY